MKLKIYSCCFFLCCMFFSMLGQESIIYSKVQQEKNKGKVFNSVKIFSSSKLNTDVLRSFKNKEEVYFFSYDNSILKTKKKTISIDIPMGSTKMSLELIEVDNSFYDYTITTGSGKIISANRSNKHYQGIVKGNPNSLAAVSFFKDDVMGIVSTEKGNFNIVKINDIGQYMIYNDLNLKERPEFECSAIDDKKFKGYDPNVLSRKGKTMKSANTPCVDLYYETKYDMFQNLGSITAVENYVCGLHNQVAVLYLNENIPTKISEIRVWDISDPYTGTNPRDLLYEFRNSSYQFSGDLGQLLTFDNIGGGIAFVNTLCNSIYNVSVSGSLSNTITNIPNYSWNVYVVAHEFGHSFGSGHTHACIWNGNNTPIDGCGTVSGCVDPGIPSGGGTIMSYCHLQSGVGINFSLGFGLQPGNVMRNNVSNASCVNYCCPIDEIVTTDLSNSTDEVQASQTITATNTVYFGGTAIYHAGQEVLLQDDFSALSGATFRAYIEGCTDSFASRSATDALTFSDEISKDETSEEIQQMYIAPNPNRGAFSVYFEEEESGILQILDFKGELIQTLEFEKTTKLSVDIQQNLPGMYFVKVRTASKTFIEKVIKK
ncbi:metallo-peptidase family M12 [Kordia sp. SMS9]|uniref:zinc-dependent metalloprotease n=1 Tax=Kordia sp. SMS9 TaxID=2282170 RepID=UPI000E0D7D27|nr:zinc-dependent metalloprotease [Kordia sp. SMS9]AXG68156.1 metallo-peptidase family M12 [Kordia sp. SMS9]